jgi:hypothetical protein
MASVLSAKPSTPLRETTMSTAKKNRIFVVLIFMAYSFSFKITQAYS